MEIEPIVFYDGNYVTCYPSSNAKDNGKLQLEFNMARLVTRVTSKNFCVVEPSFTLTATVNPETNKPVINVSEGQASINGMDIIATQSLMLDPPTTTGEHYILFKLGRDGSDNVSGDWEEGSKKTFLGVKLGYALEKDETDKDALWLGKVNWDGVAFSGLTEDEDKYGRIWAEDILCKIDDPKHPDMTRMILQDWLYKVPDWYFSKEGDVIYGKLEMLPGRLGSNEPGITMQAIDENTSRIVVKAPSTTPSGTDKILIIESTNDGTSVKVGQSTIESNATDNYDLQISSPNNIKVKSNKTLYLNGDTGVEIGAGGTANSPKLVLKDHVATFTDNNSSDLKYDISFIDQDTLQNTVGKAVWQYNDTNKTLSLLTTDVSKFIVNPDAIMNKNANVVNTLYLGSTDNTSTTYLNKNNWRLTDASNVNKYTDFKPNEIVMNNPNLSSTVNASILLKNTNDTIHTKILDDGKIELLNGTRNPNILFKDGNTTYDVKVEKIIGQKKLNIQGDLGVVALTATGALTGNGLVSTSGVLTLRNGNTDAKLTQDANSTTIRTNGNLYVGSSGTANLYAGNTTIKGTATFGSSGQCTINANGDINTNGTIRGTKVYGAVYQDFAEVFEKEDGAEIEAGDLVCIRENGKVDKVQLIGDAQFVIGICSDTAGVLLGVETVPVEKQVVVGLVGQIWAKTDEIHIKPGQKLRALDIGKVGITTGEAFAIALSDVVDGKVKVLLK